MEPTEPAKGGGMEPTEPAKGGGMEPTEPAKGGVRPTIACKMWVERPLDSQQFDRWAYLKSKLWGAS
jgi:hypothetical protein